MHTHATRTQKNQSKAVANESSGKRSGGETKFQFEDNRPETIAQRKLQKLMNNSPQAQQAAQFQAMADSYSSDVIQRREYMEEEEPLQGKFEPVQKKANKTGLPDNLKSGVENLSGYSMDDVKVHYNSPKPAQLQALAYTQGTEIHVGSGQERYLPHEAWHVVQQKQGLVQPTTQMKDIAINDDASLENEADIMGARAQNMPHDSSNLVPPAQPRSGLIQQKTYDELIQRQVMGGQVKGVIFGTRRLYNRAGVQIGNVPKNTALQYDTTQTLNNLNTENGTKNLYRVTQINLGAITNQHPNIGERDIWVSQNGVKNSAAAAAGVARGEVRGGGPYPIYDNTQTIVANFLEGAEFDYDTNQVVVGGIALHQISNYNREYMAPVAMGALPANIYIAAAHVRVSGGATYVTEKAARDQDADNITAAMGIQHGNVRYAVSGTPLPLANEYTQACYNFAVGSFNALNGIKHLQAAIPSYIDIRSGSMGDQVLDSPTTLHLMDAAFAAAMTPAIILKVEAEMTTAGVNLVVGTHVNGGASNAQRNQMWLPLQKLILRLSGLSPNPDGQWAVGFRGHDNSLGSDHAWIEAYSSTHLGYISFDTFPKADLRVSRNRNSDPIVVPAGQLENRIRITGPAAAQMALINLAPAAGGLAAGQ